MSRWNPCCCGGPVILPDDMVLVRAGWYHFMVLTKDGRIQVFIGSGTKITENDTLFLSQGIVSKSVIGPDGTNVKDSPLWYIDELGIHTLNGSARYNLDPDAWKLVHGGTHAFDGFAYDWGEGEIADDYRVDPPVKQGGINPFGMITLYPEACVGWGGTTGISGSNLPSPPPGSGGACASETLPEGWYNPANGFPSTPNPAVSVGGCPHYKIIGNIDSGYYLYPDRPMEFNGSGISIGRPPGTVRHSALVEARGLSLVPGITLQTLYESYDLVAKPVPAGHPLEIPATLKSRLDSGEVRVVDIECGAYHNIVRLNDNSIVCWGLNAYGQCNTPAVLGPSWEVPNGQITSAGIDLSGLSGSEKLVKIENPELRIFETGIGTLTGRGAKVRLLTNLAPVPDGPRIWEVTGIEILEEGKGYRPETINWALPQGELNAGIIGSGITFTVAPITDLSDIKTTICSIHAGFNTSAVLFHGGTALCWGDPDVADQVNSWEHIRISPIRKGPDDSTNCNGTNTQGYPDPEFPDFPENKYKKGVYNANTDWWELWRSGAPAYPHFDLGVQTNKIYPLQWDFSQPFNELNDTNAVPYGICDQCNTYWNNSGQDKIKDFAVAMLRTGQIVTTRKTEARDSGAPLCRDCSYDEKYEVSSGNVGLSWIGPNLSNYEGPLSDDVTLVNCLEFAQGQGIITTCSGPGNYKICDEYKRWFIPSEKIQCGEESYQEDRPEGIGCYSSIGNLEPILYDQNWAYSTEFYSPAKQVRPSTHPNGAVPSWNTAQKVNATYGWETLVAATDRDHRASDPGFRGFLPEQCLTKVDYMPSKCVMNIATAPCMDVCPSTAGFIGEFRREGNVDQYGVPGVFRYPAQIANTLMCSAGTNTVNWMYYPRLLSADAFEDPNLGSEENAVKPAGIVINNCPKFHLGKGPNPCSECGNYTNAPGLHIEEIADTTTACIYANSNNPSEDDLNNSNPLVDGDVGDPCAGRQIGEDETFMLPTRAWGPWQLVTSSGTASPLETELSLCAKGLLSYSFCAYMKITRRGAAMPSLDGEFGGGGLGAAGDGLFDMVPAWFTNYYIGPNSAFNLGSPVDAVNLDDELARRPIRRDGGIRPTSSSWKVNFLPPRSIQGCFYPDACFDKDQNGNLIIPPQGDTLSGRCPRDAADPTTPEEPLSYVDCSVGKYGPCGGGILGGQVVNLNKYCFYDGSIEVDLFPAEPMCLDTTSNVCGAVGCDQGIGNSCNKWFLNNPAISYATGRGFSVFVRRSPWYRPEASIISDIAAGGEHSVALKSDGEFFGWGRNLEGQSTKTSVRMKVLEAGKNHNILITKGAEQVLCFGDNAYGQCDTPAGLAGSTAVSAGEFHSMALKKNFTTNNNEVFCWGCVKEIFEAEATEYLSGDIIDDVDVSIETGDDPLYPGLVVSGISGPGGISGRKADLYFDHLPVTIPQTRKYDMEFRIKNFGGVTATVAVEDYDKWVDFKPSRMATFQIPLTGVQQIYGVTQNWITVKVKDIQMTRPSQRFVIRDITSMNGGATGWDFNWFRVLPQEPNNKGQCDVPVTGVTSPSAISAGKYHSVAIIDPGSSIASNVICWGDNSVGQCNVPAGLTGVIDVKAGDFYTIALTERETVKCWGSIDCSDVEGLTGIISISAGAAHGMVLKEISATEREIIPFGDASYGLGIVPSGITFDPSGLTGIYIEKISAGGSHNMVLRSDNVVKAWGRNNYGQITVPSDIATTGLVGGEFIWEPTCPTTLEQSFPNINFNASKGWGREFVGTRGTKIWITGNVLDPCPPWPLTEGITAYYPEWVPRASGDRVAKKGLWISGTWTPTGGTGPDSYEKSINISGFTLTTPNGHPLASTSPATTNAIPLYEKVLAYFQP